MKNRRVAAFMIVGIAAFALGSAQNSRYDILADVAEDRATGLMWQRGISEGRCNSSEAYTWEEARSLCTNLVLGGFDDWRLPSYKELHSLIERTYGGPSVDEDAFPDTPGSAVDFLWSATPAAWSPDAHWVVGLAYGAGVAHAHGGTSFKDCVKCVRNSR